jgi:ATP-dependent RNA helicase DHX37/DHR1
MFTEEFPSSDAIRVLYAVGAYTLEYAKSIDKAEVFCDAHFLRSKAMEEIRKLRFQITHIVKTVLVDSNVYPSVTHLTLDPRMKPPCETDMITLRQVLLSGYSDHVCRLDVQASRRFPQYGSKNALPVYTSMWSEHVDVLQIHPSSTLFRNRPAPEWIVFDEIIGREERMSADNQVMALRGAASQDLLGHSLAPTQTNEPRKFWLKGVTMISDKWLFSLGSPNFVSQGQLLDQPCPTYDLSTDSIKGWVTPHYGPKLWPLPPCETALDMEPSIVWFGACLLQGQIPLDQHKSSLFHLVLVSLVIFPNVASLEIKTIYSHQGLFSQSTTRTLSVTPSKRKQGGIYISTAFNLARTTWLLVGRLLEMDWDRYPRPIKKALAVW